MFRRNAISRESPVHRRQVGGLEPTVAREHVCGPDVISTATVNGAREGARVEIMSVGCPQTAGRASRSGAGLTIGRRGGGTSAALFSMVGAWLKKWLGWMDQDGMVVGWLSSGWTDGCVRMGQDKDGWSADE